MIRGICGSTAVVRVCLEIGELYPYFRTGCLPVWCFIQVMGHQTFYQKMLAPHRKDSL